MYYVPLVLFMHVTIIVAGGALAILAHPVWIVWSGLSLLDLIQAAILHY